MANVFKERLVNSVKADFAKLLGGGDKRLARLLEKIQSGKGTFEDVSAFSSKCGEALSEALSANISPAMMRSSEFTQDIANEILAGMLRQNYELINMAAQAVQENIDSKMNIHISAQKPEFPTERVSSIASSLKDENASDATLSRRIDSPVRNVSDSFYSDYVKENAELRSSAGLKAVVIRQTNGNCCDWCSSLAGRYEYPDVPDGIWGFHDNCTCSVTYSSSKTTSIHNRGNKRGRRLEGKEREEVLARIKKPTVYTKEQAKDLQSMVLNRLANSGESGIIISGAISGALNPNSKEAQEHADQYYEAVRHMTNDVKRIAQNTGFSEDLIDHIKKFIFLDEHELNGEIKRFDSSYEMAQSWQRLIEGKNILPHDLTLIKHEEMERNLMLQGYDQDEAHRITSEKYNYSKEANEYYGKIERNRKKW